MALECGPGSVECSPLPQSRLVGRAQLGTIQNNLGNFLLLNPDFFFGASEPAQKAVLVPFFWGGVYDLFFLPTFFLISEGFQWGCVSELKIPKSEVDLLKPGKLGPL